MGGLKEILMPILKSYTGEALNGFSILTQDIDGNWFSIIATGYRKEKHFTFTVLIVRIMGELVIIEEDRNSDPVYEELIEAGIPREQIILAYAGEAVPDTA